jgi:thiol-disulfide isomerase/thioredoxin
MSGTSADSLILRRISLNEKPTRTIDSGLLRYTRDSLVFDLPLSKDDLYEFSLMFSSNRVYCIPDNHSIRIILNRKTGKNIISGSPVSMALLKFREEQDSLQKMGLSVNNEIQQRYYNFSDTVSSSAAFMENYDYIDFGTDYNRMKKLVSNAAARFPHAAPVQRLNSQVAKLVHIYEKELQAGDLFPELMLPDLDGNPYAMYSAKGKYIFIDFWSMECTHCFAYINVKKELAKRARKNLLLISVAMDNNTELCKEAVRANQLTGVQLIDKNIWQGQTASKLAFDSIPYNFLVSPDHRILAKAIPADSVITVLNRYK